MGEPLQYPLFFIQRFKGRVLFNVPMSEYTSLKVGGPADVMAFPVDEADLRELMAFARTKGFEYHIIGAGSNLLVRDGGIRGIVINMADGFKDIIWQEGAKAIVGSGVKLSELVSGCTERGFSGVEFACGIPGTVGGAVAMNAGAWGSEMKDVVSGVDVVRAGGRRGFLSNEELSFGYRSSKIPAGAVVYNAHLEFTRKTPEEVRSAVEDYRTRRKNSARITLPSAGSVFKNPEGGYAGKLIEEAGMKGQRVGDAVISTAHANYIVNEGRATAKDILALVGQVRDKVYSETGVVLEPEIKVVGEDS